MGSYNTAVITTVGQALLTSVIGAQGTMTFTKLQTSSYAYASGTDLSALTSLNNVEQEANIGTATIVDSTHIAADATISNSGISTEYNANTLGIFASDGVNEVLFAVSTAVTPDVIPADQGGTPSTYKYNFTLAVSSTSDITISAVGNIDASDVAYDNSVSGLSATNVQAAIDELARAEVFKTYTINIDFSDSNPDTWGSYFDCSVTNVSDGGGENEIDEFMGYYPCLLKNGVEGVKLNPNNYAQDINGNSVDITSGSDGDVMIKFPARGYMISQTGTILTVSITNEPNKTGFTYLTYKGDPVEAFYHSAYEGYYDGSKLRSLSGKTPTITGTSPFTSIATFRTNAQANGTGYEQRTYDTLVYLQCCALIKYRGRNMQVALGRGFVDGNSASHTTGGTNTKGLNYGETTGKEQIKLFGIEDFWGNVYDWIDGIVTDATLSFLTADGNFNNDGTGYTNRLATGATGNTYGNYTSKLFSSVNAKTGFITSTDGISGSATTYFCDYFIAGRSCVALYGGNWNRASYAGLVAFTMTNNEGPFGNSTDGRIIYFKVAA